MSNRCLVWAIVAMLGLTAVPAGVDMYADYCHATGAYDLIMWNLLDKVRRTAGVLGCGLCFGILLNVADRLTGESAESRRLKENARESAP